MISTKDELVVNLVAVRLELRMLVDASLDMEIAGDLHSRQPLNHLNRILQAVRVLQYFIKK